MYHRRMRPPLIINRLMTLLSASCLSSVDRFFSLAMRWSILVSLRFCFCLRARSWAVKPTSSSSCRSSSLKLSRPQSLSLSWAPAEVGLSSWALPEKLPDLREVPPGEMRPAGAPR